MPQLQPPTPAPTPTPTVPAPAPPPPTTASTATWGAEHLDRAPTPAEVRAQAVADAQVQAQARAAAAQDVSLADAVKTIKAADFLTVYTTPCARQGLLTGIGSGAAVGMLRYVLGAPVPRAANWAVGAFALGSIVSYEVCQAARRAERIKMQRVVEVFDRKQADLKAAADKAARAKAAAEAAEAEAAAKRAAQRWYKFW